MRAPVIKTAGKIRHYFFIILNTYDYTYIIIVIIMFFKPMCVNCINYSNCKL